MTESKKTKSFAGRWYGLATFERGLIVFGILITLVLFVYFEAERKESAGTQTPLPAPAKPYTPLPRVTKENYAKLSEGMTITHVNEVLGPVSEVKYETRDKTGSSGVYQWGTTTDGFIICTFQNDKLISKTQVSLKY